MQRGHGLAADSTSTSAAHNAGARRGRTGATRRAAIGGAGPALGALVLAACATTGAPGGSEGRPPPGSPAPSASPPGPVARRRR